MIYVYDLPEDDSASSPPRSYDFLVCQEMASRMNKNSQLPAACQKYPDIVSNLRRRETDTTHGTEILG
jgi:hypothetical protein